MPLKSMNALLPGSGESVIGSSKRPRAIFQVQATGRPYTLGTETAIPKARTGRTIN
jgi:hypothetical protein